MKKAWFSLAAGLLVLCLASPDPSGAATYASVPNHNSTIVSSVAIHDQGITETEVSDAFGGNGYYGVAITPEGLAYVANPSINAVYVLDPSDGQFVHTIQKVGTKPIGVAASPVDGFVYVTNQGSNDVAVIDANQDPPTVVTRFKVGNAPVGVAVSPDGNHIYVVNSEGDQENFDDVDAECPECGSVWVLAAEDGVKEWRVILGNKPLGVAVSSPDGERLYVTNSQDGNVSVINTSTKDELTESSDRLAVGVRPVGVAVSPDGSRVFVANRASDSVSIIKTATDIVDYEVTDIDVGINPTGVSVTPDGAQVYVTERGSDTDAGSVTIIHMVDNQVISLPNYEEMEPAAFGNFIGSVSVPEAPTDLDAVAEADSKITLSWNDNSLDETGFEICRKKEAFGGESCNQEPGETCDELFELGSNVKSYEDTKDLIDSTTYFYYVRAVNSRGGSPYVCSSATTPLRPPSGLRDTDANQKVIELAWTDNSSSESGFRIERKKIPKDEDTESVLDDEGGTDSETFSLIATVGAEVTSYKDHDVEGGMDYVYRVQAYTDSEDSDYSNELEVRASDTCFIATAAYGSLFEPHVVILRRFRDAHLLNTAVGGLFVRAYHKHSPPIADFISRHETLRIATRIGLYPLVAVGYLVIQFGYGLTLIGIGSFLGLGGLLLSSWQGWRCRRSQQTTG